MRAFAKLQRCGNATHIAIPKAACEWLGWLQGEIVVFQLHEDHSVSYRKPDTTTFAPKRQSIVVMDAELPLPSGARS